MSRIWHAAIWWIYSLWFLFKPTLHAFILLYCEAYWSVLMYEMCYTNKVALTDWLTFSSSSSRVWSWSTTEKTVRVSSALSGRQRPGLHFWISATVLLMDWILCSKLCTQRRGIQEKTTVQKLVFCLETNFQFVVWAIKHALMEAGVENHSLFYSFLIQTVPSLIKWKPPMSHLESFFSGSGESLWRR